MKFKDLDCCPLERVIDTVTYNQKEKNTLVSTIGFNQFPHHRTHRLNLWAHLALNNRRQLESKMDGPLGRTTVEIELAWN